LIALVIVVGGTIAYFLSSTSFENKFRTSYYDVAIEEVFRNDWGVKEVSIVNYDSASVAVRISYDEIWLKQNDSSEIKDYLSNKVFDNTTKELVDVVIKDWTQDWKENFIDGNDGWYYYKKVLPSNGRVQILNSINLDEKLLKANSVYDTYVSADYELDFNYEAVQADNKAIKELWGHDVTITNNEIEWSFN